VIARRLPGRICAIVTEIVQSGPVDPSRTAECTPSVPNRRQVLLDGEERSHIDGALRPAAQPYADEENC
jgi:hypothetical protein